MWVKQLIANAIDFIQQFNKRCQFWITSVLDTQLPVLFQFFSIIENSSKQSHRQTNCCIPKQHTCFVHKWVIFLYKSVWQSIDLSQGGAIFLTGLKTRLWGIEIQHVQWTVLLLFNNTPIVQLIKCLSKKKKKKHSVDKLHKTVLKVCEMWKSTFKQCVPLVLNLIWCLNWLRPIV